MVWRSPIQSGILKILYIYIYLYVVANTAGQWHALVDCCCCCGQHRRPVGRSSWLLLLLWPTPQASGREGNSPHTQHISLGWARQSTVIRRCWCSCSGQSSSSQSFFSLTCTQYNVAAVVISDIQYIYVFILLHFITAYPIAIILI